MQIPCIPSRRLQSESSMWSQGTRSALGQFQHRNGRKVFSFSGYDDATIHSTKGRAYHTEYTRIYALPNMCHFVHSVPQVHSATIMGYNPTPVRCNEDGSGYKKLRAVVMNQNKMTLVAKIYYPNFHLSCHNSNIPNVHTIIVVKGNPEPTRTS
jgi:hypothetical protein